MKETIFRKRDLSFWSQRNNSNSIRTYYTCVLYTRTYDTYLPYTYNVTKRWLCVVRWPSQIVYAHMQHTATQRTATHCNSTHCNTLQHNATHASQILYAHIHTYYTYTHVTHTIPTHIQRRTRPLRGVSWPTQIRYAHTTRTYCTYTHLARTLSIHIQRRTRPLRGVSWPTEILDWSFQSGAWRACHGDRWFHNVLLRGWGRREWYVFTH